MKKAFCIFAAAFAAVVCAGCAAGGSENSENSGGGSGTAGSGAQSGETAKGYRMVNDFEDYATGVQPMMLLNYFGKVSLNTDLRYVRSGKGSLKVVPEGCASERKYAPTLKQPLKIESTGEDFGDISRVKMFTTQIYNDSESAVNMKMQTQFFGGHCANEQSFTLNSGWNVIAYMIDPQILDISYDVYDCKGVLYVFDYCESGAPTLYFDDLRVYESEKEFSPLDTSVSENEVCSFDKLYQEYVLIPNVRYPAFAPKLEINSDARYAKRGKSLKVTMPKNDGSFTTYTYTGFSFNKKFINSVGLGEYSDEKYFSFWVYNSGTSRQRLFLEFYDYGGITYYKNTQVYVNAGEWHNVRIKMSDLSGGAAAMTTGNAGEININWEINSLTEDRVLYFDSFEICD